MLRVPICADCRRFGRTAPLFVNGRGWIEMCGACADAIEWGRAMRKPLVFPTIRKVAR